MKIIVAVAFVGSIVAPASLALAANFPSHASICLDDKGNKSTIVSKERLAKELLKADAAASRLYIDVDTINPGYKYKWQAIFTDKGFCASDRACFAPAADGAGSGQNPAGGGVKPGGKPPPPPRTRELATRVPKSRFPTLQRCPA